MPMLRAGECPWRARLVPRSGAGAQRRREGIVCPCGTGRRTGEGDTNLFFSFLFKKKKKSANLHHDFLTNVGEGGLPAWSCLIWSL